MFRSNKAECDAKIKKLTAESRRKIDEIEAARRELKTQLMRVFTKELGEIYKKMGKAYLDYANSLKQTEKKVSALCFAKDHYQLAIDELSKFAYTMPGLSLYLDQLHILDQLLKHHNIFADFYARQMLAIISRIEERGLLQSEHLHHVFLRDNETLHDFAYYWLPIYSEHAKEEIRPSGGFKRPLARDNNISDSEQDDNSDYEPSIKRAKKSLADSVTIPSPLEDESALEEKSVADKKSADEITIKLEPTTTPNINHFNFFIDAPPMLDVDTPAPQATKKPRSKRFKGSHSD